MHAIEIEPIPATGDRSDFRIAISSDSGLAGFFTIQMTGSVLSTNWSDGRGISTTAHRLAEALIDSAKQPEALTGRRFMFSTYTTEPTIDSTIVAVHDRGLGAFEI
jgi:hypothetical protein